MRLPDDFGPEPPQGPHRKMELLPGFEPGSLDSKSRVLTNYTIRPLVVVGAAVSVAHDMPSWLSWQSARLLTDRSLVRAQVEALFPIQ